jgi:hypothetical protein
MNHLKNTTTNNKSHLLMIQHDISKLYCSLFKKLGCVILAMIEGDSEKPIHYLKRINFVIKSIKHKMRDVINTDKQYDLELMLNNLHILEDHMKKDIKHKKNIVNKTIKNNNTNGIEYKTTLCGLYKWYESAFSQLGWILLAHNTGDIKRVSEYIRMLYSLHKTIISRHHITEDNDLKSDLEIMANKVRTLLNHVENDFK